MLKNKKSLLKFVCRSITWVIGGKSARLLIRVGSLVTITPRDPNYATRTPGSSDITIAAVNLSFASRPRSATMSIEPLITFKAGQCELSVSI